MTTSSIGTLILDAGPIIGNTTLPPAHTYLTTPSVLAELRDEGARLRLQSLPNLVTRAPIRSSIDFVRTFAKKTGDAEVLSAADVGIIALTYEVECEANGGDWRLRQVPGQARINGAPPAKPSTTLDDTTTRTVPDTTTQTDEIVRESLDRLEVSSSDDHVSARHAQDQAAVETHNPITAADNEAAEEEAEPASSQDETAQEAVVGADSTESGQQAVDHVADEEEEEEDDDDDDDDWITPNNIQKHQARDNNIDATAQEVKTIKVACATHDFAVQNVLLQIGLNLVSGDGRRITSVKTWVLRCHACFKVTRKMDLRFCPSCGGATLMRTSVSTDGRGATKVHLKRNMQWNNRGTVYAIPTQRHGTANMKGRGNLILRADQREVEKREKRDRYRKAVDLLDPDFVPSIVSGRRDVSMGDNVRFGHGKRNPNANRRR